MNYDNLVLETRKMGLSNSKKAMCERAYNKALQDAAEALNISVGALKAMIKG